METPLDFIIRITKELVTIPLPSKFGNDVALVSNGDDVFVKSFVGKYGYSLTDIKSAKKDFINSVYEDLKKDFK